MSENCHNSGRIYWNLLENSISYKVQYHDGNPRYKCFINENMLKHFCNTMETVIVDYAKTYKSSNKSSNKLSNDNLDPIKWRNGFCMIGSGAQIGYSTSLLMNYILLNLILLNSKKINESKKLSQNTWIYNVCSGVSDYSHPKHIASKFIKIREKLFHNEIAKPLTKEIVKDVRNYLKNIFECLVRIQQNQQYRDTINSKSIFEKIKWWFGVY